MHCARPLQSELESVAIPKNPHKVNIVGQTGELQRSLLLGAYTAKGTGVTSATNLPKFKRVLELVHEIAKSRDADVPYSGIMINLGVDTGVHRDMSNLTLNDVLVLGEFSDGHVIVEDDAGHEVLRLADGTCVNGRKLEAVRGRWSSFDATRWHQVTKAKGVRISRVASLVCM
eukprot:2398273-Amphidinium_carterae.1